MSIIVSDIRVPIDDADNAAIYAAKKRLGVENKDVKSAHIYKKSLDARHNVSFVMSVLIDLYSNESEIVKAISDSFVTLKSADKPILIKGSEPLLHKIVIIGCGPAGLWAALTLAENGYNPILLERGCDIDKRVETVNRFWTSGALDENCNVQFGEGGAGTFSDGKLTTRISDPRCGSILEALAENGAPQEILTSAKPHIGTDKLRGVIKNIRNKITDLGGEVRFNSLVEKIIIKNNRVCGVSVNGEILETDNVVLAIGHSARDMFYSLNECGVKIENKSFSVGVRIEQLQTTINRGLYGNLFDDDRLPIGEYRLSHRLGEKAVYTFCMCPGGFVVPSASEAGGVVVNGMSEHSRSGKNANSALAVSVSEADYGSRLFDGVKFQRQLEQTAFKLGNEQYKAPAQTIDAFLTSKAALNLKEVEPSYSIGVVPADFNSVFPQNISKLLRLGLQCFNSKLNGFSKPDGILTGVETRTSSPVRILRDSETMQSVSVGGLYPCGEGAGYAGGIMSAAADGMRVAEKIMSIYKSN